MQVWFPERTQSPFPLWIRIFVGAFSLVVGLLILLTHPLDVRGVPQLCLGTWFLFFAGEGRQLGESRSEYFKKPRVIVSFLLLLMAMVSSVYTLITGL